MLADLESLIMDSLASIRCDELFRGFHYGKEFEGLSFRSGKKTKFSVGRFHHFFIDLVFFGKPSIEEDTQILLTNAAHFLEILIVDVWCKGRCLHQTSFFVE